MLIPEGFAQVNWHIEVEGHPFPAEVTLGLDVSANTDTGQEVADLLYDAWTDHLGFHTSTFATLTMASVKFGPNDVGPTYEAFGTETGSRAGEVVGPQEAFLIRKSTAIGGRQGRGRMYLPGCLAAQLNPTGLWEDQYITDVQSGATSVQSFLAAQNVFAALLHTVGTPDQTPELITSMTAQSRVATQRRRNRR